LGPTEGRIFLSFLFFYFIFMRSGVFSASKQCVFLFIFSRNICAFGEKHVGIVLVQSRDFAGL